MTTTVRVTTHGHTAFVKVGSSAATRLDPGSEREFYAHDAADILVTETDPDEGTVHADDTGDAGPPPRDVGHG
jgi:hypothetical protein